MCQRFIEDFTNKVVDRINYNSCLSGYYKDFDSTLLYFVPQIHYHSHIPEQFYIDIALFYLHEKEFKKFIYIVRNLHIMTGKVILKKIACEVNKHQKCIPIDNTIVFLVYDNISWNELSYINAEDKDKYYGEKRTLLFNEWILSFLKMFL